MDFQAVLSGVGPSAVDVVVAISKATNSKEDAIAALKTLASGRDGVAGTADDVIPPAVVAVLTFLIENGVAEDILGLVAGGAGSGCGGGCGGIVAAVVNFLGGVFRRFGARK